MSSLMVHNKTATPVTLTGLGIVVPASSDPPLRGQGVNVTSKLKNLTKAQYLALETQRQAAGLDYTWTESAEYSTDSLQVEEPAILRQKNRKNAWQGVMTKGDEIHIAVCNATERVSDGEAAQVARILDLFLSKHFCPSWGMRTPSVQFYTDWSKVPTDSRTFICLLLNDAIITDDGEAGFHDQFNNRVIARVSCDPILDQGGGITGVDPQAYASGLSQAAGITWALPSVSYVACVEVCESLVDGMINNFAIGPRLVYGEGDTLTFEKPPYPYGNFTGSSSGPQNVALWFKEANDPVELTGFYIADNSSQMEPEGGLLRQTLGLVPNFVLPNYFNIRSPDYVPAVEGQNAKSLVTLVPGSQLVDGDYWEFTMPFNYSYGFMPTRIKIIFTNDPEPPFPDYPTNPEDGVDVEVHIPFTPSSTTDELYTWLFNATTSYDPIISNAFNLPLLVGPPPFGNSEPQTPLELWCTFSGSAFNAPVTEYVADPGFLVTDFTGGTDYQEGVFVAVDFLGVLPGPFKLWPGGGLLVLQGEAVEYIVEGRNSVKGGKKGALPPVHHSTAIQMRYRFPVARVRPYRTREQKLAKSFSYVSRRVDSHGLRSRVNIRNLTD